MRLLSIIYLLAIVGSHLNAATLELKTARNQLCGDELYNEKRNHPSCPASLVNPGSERAGCVVHSEETRPNDDKCGVTQGRCFCWDDGNGECSNFASPLSKCLAYTSKALTCTYPTKYKCYEPCRLPEFGVERYKSCRFYLNTDDVEKFVRDVKKDLPFFKRSLVSTKGLLLTLQQSENDLACHIFDYETDPFTVDLINNLKNYFKDTFGYPYDPGYCSVSPTEIQDVILDYDDGRLRCNSITDLDLETLSKPESATEADFERFLEQCSAEKNLEYIIDWFTDSQEDIQLLSKDLTAQKNQNLATQLHDLDLSVSSAQGGSK